MAIENARRIRNGEWDHHEGVQETARHRLASTPTALPGAEDVASIVKRLRDAANGVGPLKSNQGDYGLCDDAADLILALIPRASDEVPANPVGEIDAGEREAIESAIQATEYKYFGCYELSADQQEAVDQLVLTAQHYLALKSAPTASSQEQGASGEVAK